MIHWIKDKLAGIDWEFKLKYIGFCALLLAGLIVVSVIHYYIFTKPVEDRVSAEWQEKYDEMVTIYENQMDDMRRDFEDENDKTWKVAYDDGYKEGYDDGYYAGYDDGNDEGYSNGHADGRAEGYDEGYEVGIEKGYEDGFYDGSASLYDDE